MSDLKNEIHDYWTNRARGYSEYNKQEMADARRTMWRDKLLSLLGEAFPEREPGEIKILDVGTPDEIVKQLTADEKEGMFKN